MGQNDVYQFLKKNKGKWFNSKEIAEAIEVGSSSISISLKRLRKHKMVLFKKNPEKGSTYLYRFK
jgi:predicted transcriptional regulator